jgi:phosphohistidine phosphatase
MQLLIVRHAIAQNRLLHAATNTSDDLRPLTPKGRRRMNEVARGLRRLVPEVEMLATSPLVRAVQTAEILAEEFGGPAPVQMPILAAGSRPTDIVRWLTSCDVALLMLVGHEPDLSQLIGWLTNGTADSFVNLKKGAACLLECSSPPKAGACRLQWLLTPRQLRILSVC